MVLKLFELQHVTLHEGVIGPRMMNWINKTSIRSITLIGAELKSLVFLLEIPHIEVINLKGCTVNMTPEMNSILMSSRITIIQDDMVTHYHPRIRLYADRATNIALLKHRKCVNFADMVEIPWGM